MVLSAQAQLLSPVKPPEYRTYFQDFIHDSHGIIKERDLRDVTIQFKSLKFDDKEGGVIGDCVSIAHTVPFVIDLEPRYWNEASEVSRKALIYHELGHCACGRPHTVEKPWDWLNDLFSKIGVYAVHAHRFLDGCPDSLMNWLVPERLCLFVHQQEYRKEMFTLCKAPLRLDAL
jgi:hypothetical protein